MKCKEATEAVFRVLDKFQDDYEGEANCSKCDEEMVLYYRTWKNSAVIYGYCKGCDEVLMVDFLHRDREWKSCIELNEEPVPVGEKKGALPNIHKGALLKYSRKKEAGK